MRTSFKYALRSLKRTPVFAITTVVTLTLGVGSLAAMFAIVHGVLLEPLSYGHPERVVNVALEARSPELRRILQPPGAYYTYKRFARTIDDIGFYRTGNANIWVDANTDTPERLTSTWITASTIPLLQVAPLLGRTFTLDEDRARGPEAVIISESIWRSRFRGSRDVLGKKLFVNAVPRTVVGVMPELFRFPASDTKLWLPAKIDRSTNLAGDFTYLAVARLSAGASTLDAQRELTSVLPRLAELYPRLESGTPTSTWLDAVRPSVGVMPLRDEITHGIARTLWLLAAAAGLVFLVACANVANLMLIRGDGRQLELAVREALGASRVRLAAHFLGESVILAAAAGGASLLATWWAVRALVAYGPADVPRLSDLGVDLTTVSFVVGVSLVAAVLCAIVPTVRVRRANLSINLRDGGRGDTAGKTRQRIRATIAAVQIAIALVVVAGSTLLLRTFQRLYEERPGFETNNVMTVWTQLPFARYGDSAAVFSYARLTAAAAALPGVRAVGLTSRLPLGDGEVRQQSFRARGDGRLQSLPVVVIDDGFFSAMGIPLMAGRGFQRTGTQPDGEVIVSRRAAMTIWNDPRGRSVLGRQLMLDPGGEKYTVIGVAGDVRDRDLASAPAATVYMPQAVPMDSLLPRARRTLALVVKTEAPPATVVASIRKLVHDLDPTVPIFNVETMSDVVRASTARLSLILALMSVAAAITLVLGAIGLYGVMAYMVALRTREFGVRVALGADPRLLGRRVVTEGMALIAYGIVAGLFLFAVAAPFLRAFLYGVGPADPVTLGGATLVLLATGALANWLPARRAARVDPAEALRAE